MRLNINNKSRKKAVSTQSQELEALEARLKETEERLKQRQSMTFPSPTGINSRTGYHRRPPIDRTFSIENAENGQRTASSAWAMNSPAMESSSSETPAQPSYDAPPVPGALPETPSDNTASDYVVVDRDGETKGNRKYWVSTSDEPTPEKVAPQPTRKPPPQPTG